MKNIKSQYPHLVRELQKEEKEAERQIEGLLMALTKPVVVMDPGWGVPEMLQTHVTVERMVQMVKGERGIATDAEALAYCTNASLCAPPSGTWFNVYMHLAKKCLGDRAPDFLEGDCELNEYERRELDKLKTWLWKQSESAWKARYK